MSRKTEYVHNPCFLSANILKILGVFAENQNFFLNQTKKDCRSKSFVFHHYGEDAYDDIIWQLKTLTNNRTSYLNQYNDIQFKDSKQ